MIKENKNRCYEQMTCINIGKYTVRVWTTSRVFVLGPDQNVIRAAQELDSRINSAPYDISQKLDRLPNIAAYEILNPLKNGIIVYPDWGNEDASRE